jgi:predicted secreted protein
MLTRRDVAMLTWYAVLFSAIVLWASLRSSDQAPSSIRGTPRAASTPESVDQDVRHITQRTTR